MNCCVECFSDTQIQTMISANGKTGTCDFCGRTNVSICAVDEPSDVSDLISEVLSVYEEADDGEPLFSVIIDNWNVFKKDFPSSHDLIAAFCSTIYGDDGRTHNKKVRIPKSYTDEYGIFSGHTWREFSNAIKTKNRFCNGYFRADQFVSFLSYSITKYSKGTEFFRARICDKAEGFTKDKMGPPPVGKRKSGRVNPEGIGVLYLTSDESTALREVRASAFDYVTLGKFKLLKDIKVVNISGLNSISPAVYSSGLESLAANTKIFSDIAKEIAKPLRRNDSSLEYLPTQFITEFIKSKGYAGVSYMSTMGTGGTNIAVFDESLFECVSVHVVEINSINYSYSEVGLPTEN